MVQILQMIWQGCEPMTPSSQPLLVAQLTLFRITLGNIQVGQSRRDWEGELSAKAVQTRASLPTFSVFSVVKVEGQAVSGNTRRLAKGAKPPFDPPSLSRLNLTSTSPEFALQR